MQFVSSNFHPHQQLCSRAIHVSLWLRTSSSGGHVSPLLQFHRLQEVPNQAPSFAGLCLI